MTRALDVIGLLYDPPAEEGGEPVLLPGFHVNTAPHDLGPLLQHLVAPSPLRRVWAGDDPAAPAWTVPLRFTDEAQARAVLGDWDGVAAGD